jgi:WbqC-like protein
MKVGIMQPYFFPYLGHFGLIDAVDEWVVFDVTQYTPKTWMNRNRILHPKESWQYVTVPLANSSNSIKTHEAKILDIKKAKHSIIGKISHYKRYAPYFYKVNEIVSNAFDNTEDGFLVSLNINTLQVVCDYIGIPFHYRRATELALKYPDSMAPGDWAPFISEQIGASEYVNPVGGKAIFDKSVFESKHIELYFAEFDQFQYDTAPYEYQAHLSILDVMMWNSAETILDKMRENTTLTKL